MGYRAQIMITMEKTLVGSAHCIIKFDNFQIVFQMVQAHILDEFDRGKRW